MKRFLQTLAIAFVLLFVCTIPFALADTSCPSGKTHISKIQSDIDQMKLEPGWETTAYQVVENPASVKALLDLIFAMPDLIVSAQLEEKARSQGRFILWIQTSGKPNAFIVVLDDSKCWVSDVPIPLKRWMGFLKTVERGA